MLNRRSFCIERSGPLRRLYTYYVNLPGNVTLHSKEIYLRNCSIQSFIFFSESCNCISRGLKFLHCTADFLRICRNLIEMAQCMENTFGAAPKAAILWISFIHSLLCFSLTRMKLSLIPEPTRSEANKALSAISPAEKYFLKLERLLDQLIIFNL